MTNVPVSALAKDLNAEISTVQGIIASYTQIFSGQDGEDG